MLVAHCVKISSDIQYNRRDYFTCINSLANFPNVILAPLSEFLVSYNLGLIFIFVVSGRIPIANNVIALTKLIARIWECGDIAKKKLEKKLKVIRNTSSQTIRILNKLTDV